MKFAIAALLGVIAADQVAVIENIKFNKEGLDAAAEFEHKAGKALVEEAHSNHHKN